MGVPLSRLEDPIQATLKAYQEVANNGLVFASEVACKLEPTPTKSNSARSESDARLGGDVIGKLFVIVFKPKDGSGSEVSYKLADLQVDSRYPVGTQVVPRNKTGVYSEGHLAIATHGIDDVHAEPRLYAGTFDLLGLKDTKIVKIGELGHPENQKIMVPVTTLTVGYDNGKRFGDPHAVYSAIPGSLQVCAFLAISDEVQKSHPNLLNSLKPQLPTRGN